MQKIIITKRKNLVRLIVNEPKNKGTFNIVLQFLHIISFLFKIPYIEKKTKRKP